MIGVEAAKAANINCLMTLPPWSNSNKIFLKKLMHVLLVLVVSMVTLLKK